jgi:hypothetical protein
MNSPARRPGLDLGLAARASDRRLSHQEPSCAASRKRRHDPADIKMKLRYKPLEDLGFLFPSRRIADLAAVRRTLAGMLPHRPRSRGQCGIAGGDHQQVTLNAGHFALVRQMATSGDGAIWRSRPLALARPPRSLDQMVAPVLVLCLRDPLQVPTDERAGHG